MQTFATLVLGFLAFGSRAVLSLDFDLQLSQVEQCQPATITVTGKANAKAIPQWLNIVPFNSTPVAILIPVIPKDANGTFRGVFTSVVPLSEGTDFVASLDDATGENVAKVSGIFRVLPSPSGNNSCLPQLPVQSRRYNFNATLVQCSTFVLTYDTTLIKNTPGVRVYNPDGGSRPLNLIEEDPASGVATYRMSFSRSKQVVMSFDDNNGHRETTPLLTVDGDNSTSTSCLNTNNPSSFKPGGDNGTGESGASSSPKNFRAIIIGSAVAGGAVLSVAVWLFAFVIRERRKHSRQSGDPIPEPVLMEKGFSQIPSSQNSSTPPPYRSPFSPARNTPSPRLRGFLLRTSPSPAPSRSPPRASPVSPAITAPGSAEIVQNPLYTDQTYSSGASSRTRDSLAFWAQPFPEEQWSHRSTHTVIPTRDRMSLDSLDIEDMLNMAANRQSQQSDPAPDGPGVPQGLARQPSSPTIPSPEPQMPPTLVVTSTTPPSSADIKRWPSRGHLRPPSDVPKGPASMTFSSISADPFNDETASFDSAIRFPPEALLALSISPRDGLSPTRAKLFVLREGE